QCIGATTLDEYRKYIEKDGALARRFQMIVVDPPNKSQTVEILRGLRDRYEAHHRVRYQDEALEMAVDLATRYINDRFLPDKAIDVIDEAGARVHLRQMTQPPDLRELEKEISRLDKEKEEAVANQDFERAAQLRDEAYKLRKRKDQVVSEWKSERHAGSAEVSTDIIAETVSKMTGIPLTRLEKGEAQRLLLMEDHLRESVIGQEPATHAIAKAVRRARSGLKDPRRPMGSFIFLGPTGVGKTHLAKSLSKFMFGSEDALIQIDMSEYMENFNASKLIGAPPGYVGYEEGGQLTEKVRRRPYSVVLLDEIEKAHHDVFNMLLQIMEEGRLTDSFGRHVDFKNVILIMTSNIGADVLKNQSSLGFQSGNKEADDSKMQQRLKGEMDRHFRPEFLNRVDEVIFFHQLTREDVKQIIDIEMREVYERIEAKGMTIELEPESKDFLLEKGYSEEYGARPMRRAIERYIEDPLSTEILRGGLVPGCKIRVSRGTLDELGFDIEQPEDTKPAKPSATK
ncbi:MAG: ATP-dependent Clp protease ATP-binding subunit, partial [Planctomycetes bacterium]|nr:ATP-dependent Clp protease ATP-binding subunit [Planctomycetota bacterium]